jgi:TolB protein
MLKPKALNIPLVLLVAFVSARSAISQTQTATAPVADIFAKADANADKTLSGEEYEALRGTTQEIRRDFLVFDLNADQKLSEAEFASIPSIGGAKRGPIPDPFADVVEQLLTVIKKQAAEKPDAADKVEFLTERFLVAFQKVINERPPNRDIADPDRDGIVTLDEAKRFFEIQIGIRRTDGQRLRFDDGRMVNNHLFLYADLNANSIIERQEFVERSYGGANVAEEFNIADTDKDDQLTLDEWCTVPGRSVDDPILNFLRYDTNLDGFVNSEELQKGVPEWKLSMTRNVFPGFDTNKDSKLSLMEFRQILPENMLAPWSYPVTDKNADEVISLDEFQFDRCTFSLLRRLYFSRLDLNGNGSLEPNEFPFKIKMHDVFYTMNADGTNWKEFYEFKDHHACGSVAVSPDGKTIAFDSWIGANQGGSALYTMDINGGEPKQICQGMMPSWSADGESLAYSFTSQGFGVWLTSLDGNREGLANGWGAQFSPDGTRVAFNVGSEIHTMELATGETTVLLQGDDNPYRSIYWNSTWSPDSKRLCFKGVRADGTVEVASILTTGDDADLKIHHSGKVNVNADFAWHPTEDRVVFAMQCAERNMVQLYQFNPSTTDAPVLVAGQDITRNNTDACWTPDGKLLIIISGDF